MVIELISRNIIPVFVFDGKPPPEKKLLLDKRRKDKTEAQSEIDKLAILIKNTPENSREYHNISTRLDSLKKRTTRVTYEDIQNVKKIFRLCGVTYYDEWRSRCLVQKLVSKNLWGLYEGHGYVSHGCPRVLRNYSLFNGTLVLYDTRKILASLNISMCNFREICVVSGTDYNYNEERKANIYKSFTYFKMLISDNTTENFYDG